MRNSNEYGPGIELVEEKVFKDILGNWYCRICEMGNGKIEKMQLNVLMVI